MGKVSESIYSSRTVTVPLADVVFISNRNMGIQVVMKGTTWNQEQGEFNNAVWIGAEEQQAFKAAWCHYRAELEAETLADLRPDAPNVE